MTVRLSISKTKNILMFGLLFFAAMNFQAKFFYFAFLSVFVMIAAQGYIKLDHAAFVYLALCGVMSIYNSDEEILSMVRCFAPVCFYLVGLNMSSNIPGSIPEEAGTAYAQKQAHMLLAVISLGSFTHYFLNFISNTGKDLGRNTNDIWTGVPMAATGQAALASLMLGLATATLFLPVRKWHRYGAMASIVVMVAYNMVLAGRSLIVILILLLLAGLLYPKTKNKRMAEKITYMLGVCAVAAVAVAVYRLNLGGVREYIESSHLFFRFGGSLDSFANNSDRTSAKLAFLADAINYPFGGLHMRQKYGYAHDLLLDGYDEYGVAGFILLCAVLIMGGTQLYKTMRKTTFSREFKLALLLINFAVWLEFMVEPILAGMAWLFSCYCLVNGCMTGMNRVYFSQVERDRRSWNESTTNQYRLR